MRLLNEVRTEQQRLAHLLGGNVELYRGSGHWTRAMIGVVFAAAIGLVLVWYFSQPTAL
jgi:hypothetical protein